MLVSRLTTTDNPYDPFDEFDKWYLWDIQHGYHTSAYLGRVARTSSDLSVFDDNLANDQAIDEIIEMNLTGVYRKVTRDIEI